MLIGYDRKSPGWGVVPTDNAAFVVDTGPTQLNDGAPQTVARLIWRDTTPTNTAQYVQIDGPMDLETPHVPRMAMLYGPRLTNVDRIPEGMKVEIRGRLASGGGYTYNLGGNSLSARTVRLPGMGGAVGVVFLFDAGLSLCDGYSVRLFNDVNGAASIDPEQMMDWAEFVVCPGAEVCAKPGYAWAWTDPSIVRRTLTSQRDRVERDPFRTLDVELSPGSEATAEQGGLANDLDWLRLQEYLLTGRDSLVFVRHTTQAGAFDVDVLNANAAFGFWTDVGGRQHVQNSLRRYTSRMRFEEIPG